MQTAERSVAEDTDETLMLAYARHGDVAAFERLYARHKGPTYRYFLRHATAHAVADELHQDVWLQVVRSRERYRIEARFTTWLYTLARHRLVDHWRSRRGDPLATYDGHAVDSLDDELAQALDDEPGHFLDPAPSDCPPGPSNEPLAAVLDAEAGDRLVAALASVSGPQRDAFLLHVEAGLSLEEIAQLADAPVETIKSRLRYAYRRLRSALVDLQ
jgi:RNA polymerase sigma-70 factor (ECF subfamily)